jgi:uncharacterized protein YqgC (DUF456 family)
VTPEQIIGLAVALTVMTVGLAGSILPGLPSTPLVLGTALLHKLYFGEASISWRGLIVLTVLVLISLGLDFLASMVGAKKLGATWRGVLGAVVGGMIGLFFSFPGILVGPFLGAMLFELVGGRETKAAALAGLGAFIGLLGGVVAKAACCVAMMVWFAWEVIASSTAGVAVP